ASIPGREIDKEIDFVYNSRELKLAEYNFAKFFARELTSTSPIIWSFERGARVTCEALIILNFKNYPIQLKGAVDLIMRKKNNKGKYVAWIVDIKTAKAKDQLSFLENEIIKRQNQLYALMASCFTDSEAIMDQEWIRPISIKNSNGQGAFMFSVNLERIDIKK